MFFQYTQYSQYEITALISESDSCTFLNVEKNLITRNKIKQFFMAS